MEKNAELFGEFCISKLEKIAEVPKLYPLSRTFLKIEIPIFRHLILEDTPYSRHPQMPLTHDSGHFDYGTHYYSIWALPSPTLAGRQGKQLCAFLLVQGNPRHSVKGCPDADASSVLSLDSIPAPPVAARCTPSSFGSFAAIGTGGGLGTINGYSPVTQN